MRKICMAIVFHSENLQSGATRSLMDIVDYLIQTQRYDILAIFPANEGTALSYLEQKGIKCYSYHYGGLMQNLTQPIMKRIVKIPFLFFRMIKIILQAKKASEDLKYANIDLVYSNTSSIIFGGFLGRYLKCKQTWHIREFRKLDHRIVFFLGDRVLQKFINKCTASVMFVSNSVRDAHTKFIDSSKMFVTYNSYSKDFISPKDCFNTNAPLHILIAGDIKPSKGQFDCIKALKKVMAQRADVEMFLHVAGRKSHVQYYQRIIDYIAQNNLEKYVIFHGQVSDMKSLRKCMDVGIVSSCNEAFGRTTIEGMLSMLAMIGRNSGGTVEQIIDGETGLLYNGTIDSLAEKLLYLNDNRGIMSKYALNGYNYCVESHTNGKCAKITEEAILYALFGPKKEN